MSGSLFRFCLFTKVLLRSVLGIVLISSFPIISIILYKEYGVHDLTSFVSMMYEHAAIIWLILIFYGICMLEFDSMILKQSITYPIARWRFVLEKLIFSYILFFIILMMITIPFSIMFGNIVLKAFVYSIPIYLLFGGVTFISTIIVCHALGGLLVSLFSYVFAALGAPLLGANYQMIMLRYGSVHNFLDGEYGYAWGENSFYYMNRLPYFAIGLVCMIIAMSKFQRKPL